MQVRWTRSPAGQPQLARTRIVSDTDSEQLAILRLMMWLAASATRHSEPPVVKRSDVLDLLEERYDRGEIEREEYPKRQIDLEQ